MVRRLLTMLGLAALAMGLLAACANDADDEIAQRIGELERQVRQQATEVEGLKTQVAQAKEKMEMEALQSPLIYQRV